MFERGRVGVIDFKRRNRHSALANRRMVGVRLHSFEELLFAQPEITAAARIGAGNQDVARDFRRLPGDADFSSPILRDIDVQENALWQSLAQDQWHKRVRESRRGAEVEFAPAIYDRNGYGRDIMDG